MYDKDVTNIIVYSHFIKIINPAPNFLPTLYSFTKDYVIMAWVREKGRKPQYTVVKTFAVKLKYKNEYRFHIGQLPLLLDRLERNYVPSNSYKLTYVDLYIPKHIDVNIKPNWILRENQLKAKEFILQEDTDDCKTRLLSMPTGTGKGITSIDTVASLKTVTVVVVLPCYQKKWVDELLDIVDVKPNEIVSINGSVQLKSLINIALTEELNYKFIVLSISTLKNFFKAYEENSLIEEEGYNIYPEDLFKVLKSGVMIIDETHQHIHAIFKLFLYTHIPKVIALSATLISDDPIIKRIHQIMFPKQIRFDEVKMKKYIKVYAIGYQFKEETLPRIRTTEFGSKNYSHLAFEKSVIKYSSILNKYLELIYNIIKVGYLNEYLKGDKLIIFASSIAMCNEILAYLKRKLPAMDIRRYVEQDPFENVIDPDIRITTILSAGTAIDIPNLRCTIMTNSVSSSVSNLQTLGRLRELTDRDVKFYYIYSISLPKHRQYHQEKMVLFKEKVLSIKEFSTTLEI